MGEWLADRRKRAIMVAIGLVLAVALAFMGFLRPFIEPLTAPVGAASSFFRRLGLPVAHGIFGDSSSVPISNDRDAARTLEELRVENSRLKTLVAENEALKSALDYAERQQDELVLAQVIYETDGDVLHGFVVNRGAADGISEGMPVLVNDGMIIGKIFEARRKSSTVMLLSDTRSRLAVSVQNGVDTVGVLEGDRGLSMRISLIPQTEVLKVGDTVVTSGLEPGVTRGLLVGTIERVDRSDENPFQSAVVTPFSLQVQPLFVQVSIGLDSDSGEPTPNAVDESSAEDGDLL